MKQYIKPATSIETIVMAQMVCTSPLDKVNEEKGNGVQMTKDRDVWSDGYWN